jgi:lipoprotein NlpI
MSAGRVATVLALLIVRLPDVHAAAPAISDDCNQAKDLNRAIVACTEEIQVNGPRNAQLFVNRGWAHFLKFDYDRAFADFEAAIRIDANDAAAYHFRGIVFQVKGDDDRAIADFTKALELGSNDPRVLLDRGSAHATKGKSAKAIADYTAAIENDSNAWIAYLLRGIAHTYAGTLDAAQADFKRGAELAPHVPYFAIWLHIAARRANAASTLATAARSMDTTKWPALAVRMFLGEEPPEAVLARGATNMKTNPYGACESNFFVAEFRYLQNQRDEAVRLYKASQQSCRRNFVEWVAATTALRSLEAK